MCCPSPGPLDSRWLLGRPLLSVVMGPECRVLSPDGVPIPLPGVCRTQAVLPRCGVQLSWVTWFRGALAHLTPLRCSSLWGFFRPASKQGHGRAGRALVGDRTRGGRAVGCVGVSYCARKQQPAPEWGLGHVLLSLAVSGQEHGLPESKWRLGRALASLPNPAFLLSCCHLSGLVRSRTPLGKPDSGHTCGGLCSGSAGRLCWAVEVLGEVGRGGGLPDMAPPSSREHMLAS